MSEELHLVTDLALILISAGVITLIFKVLKQPVVLGYIVAGFFVGPHFGIFPTVVEVQSVQEWSEIGIIFLLFALGLEFSFKKLFTLGSTAFITAGTEVITVALLGVFIGKLMGWTLMESLFLGGMLCMSSTVIVIKAFEDLGVMQQKFANITLVVLIIQDLVAILLMVLLSTAAVGQQFAGKDVLFNILKLVFFLILWFLIGIYVLPTFFHRFRKLMNDETLLIFSIGLCFGMVVLATYAGFSSALGAFVMGSILAETIEAERIDRLTKQIKDLFGAIFFVSVGMMVDPQILAAYWLPILILTFVTIFGKTFFSALGVLISGQNIKTAVQVGASLSQIGEFAFIIATLGLSLNVLSAYIYPVIVAVSVITTFTTPYCIRASEPVAIWVEKHLPQRFLDLLNRYDSGSNVVTKDSAWKKLIKTYILRILILSVLIVAIIIFSFVWFFPFVQTYIAGTWGDVLCAGATILAIAPFLRGMMINKKEDHEIITHLWGNSRYNRGAIVALLLLRIFLVVLYLVVVLSRAFSSTSWIIIVVALGLGLFLLVSKMSFSRFSSIEHRFIANLKQREEEERKKHPIQVSIQSQFAGKDIHLAQILVSPDSEMVGQTIAQTACYDKYGVSIVKIERGSKDIYLPSGAECIYPSDRLVILGTDKQISSFKKMVEDTEVQPVKHRKNMQLSSFVINEKSKYINQTIAESGIREQGGCMIVCLERNGKEIFNPPMSMVFQQNDLIWVVGEKNNVKNVGNN